MREVRGDGGKKCNEYVFLFWICLFCFRWESLIWFCFKSLLWIKMLRCDEILDEFECKLEVIISLWYFFMWEIIFLYYGVIVEDELLGLLIVEVWEVRNIEELRMG